MQREQFRGLRQKDGQQRGSLQVILKLVRGMRRAFLSYLAKLQITFHPDY
jgi:hypothetical protein